MNYLMKGYKMRKVATTKITGGAEYARVPERLKLFREDCPRGSIKTSYKILEDNKIIYEAYILKDKQDLSSGDATGHSMGSLKNAKEFEKQETVAIGRALAILGYLASGEIASFEEMEEFNEYKDEQKKQAIQEAIEQINSTSDLEALRSVFMSLGILISESEVIDAKDARKEALSADN
jgi:hypothetical protein